MRTGLLGAAGALTLALSHTGVDAAAAAEPPNVIFFLVDDLGWMDTAAYGSRYYETPNIDRLAGAGMLFTAAYAASPQCSPTRASLLTGKYPARLDITQARCALPPLPPGASRFPAQAPPEMRFLVPESRRFLPLEEVTLAEVLRQRGYRTALVGKWHLGALRQHWPDRQGFEVVFHGSPDPGPPSYFSPYGFLQGNLDDGGEGQYLTDRLTDESIEFIRGNRDRAFLLYLAHFGVHGPWGFKEELRRDHAARRHPVDGQNNPVMAAMIRSIDESLGRIMDEVERLGLAERTIIILSSDNGGAMHETIGGSGLLPTDNAPLRGAKGLLYEGGVRVPLIISWPGVVAPGSRSAEPVSSIDFYPTLLEATGTGRAPGQLLDGESLMPLLTGSGGLQRQALFTYFALSGQRAPPGVTVRSGRWKLIRWFETTPWFPDRLELYDLEADIGETTNLARRMPCRASRLDALISAFLADTGVLLPRANPDFDTQAAALFGWAPDRFLTLWPTVIGQPDWLEVRDGLLRCSLASRQTGWSGLELLFLRHRSERQLVGRHELELTGRATGRLTGRLRVAPASSPRPVGAAATFELAGGPDWQRVALPFSVAEAPVRIRLEFPTGVADVEIETIRLRALEGQAGWPAYTQALEWRFEAAAREPFASPPEGDCNR
jgi:arylsulfatase A-like enzyme